MWAQRARMGPHVQGWLGRAGENPDIFMPSPKLFHLNYTVPIIWLI